MAVDDTRAKPAETFAREGLYVRRATGLVRDISPFSATLYNMLPTAPGVGLAISVFWVLGTYQGGHILAAFWITGAVALAIALPFALLSMTMPRSGGDYIMVSRSIAPPLGLASSLSLMGGTIIFAAFVANLFVTVGIVPGLTTIGLISGAKGWVDAANTISGSHLWTFLLTMLLLVISFGISALPIRRQFTIQNVCFMVGMVGLLVAIITMLVVSRTTFVNAFNHYAGPHAYTSVLTAAKKQGIASPGTSWNHTIPAVGALSLLFAFSWWSANYGGEVRQARSSRTVAMMTVSILGYVVLFTLMTVAFFHMSGSRFVASANLLNGTKDYPLSVPPYWLVLVSMATKSIVFTIFLVLTFLFWFPIWAWLQIAQPIRALFAWSFDGVLPRRVADVSSGGAPLVALSITFVAATGCAIWATWTKGFFTIAAIDALWFTVPMLLVGLSAVLLPFLKPDLWRASPLPRSVGGIPLLSVVGLLGMCGAGFIAYALLEYPGLGVANRGETLALIGGMFVLGFVIYYVARAVQRRRHGVDISLNYSEIPPE